MIRKAWSRARWVGWLAVVMLLGIAVVHPVQRVAAQSAGGPSVTIHQPHANDGRHLQVSVHAVEDAAPNAHLAPPAGAHAIDVVVAVLRTSVDAIPGLARVSPTARLALGANRDSLPLRFLLQDADWGSATNGWQIPLAQLPWEAGRDVGVWHIVALVDAPRPSASPVVIIDDVVPGVGYLYVYLVLARPTATSDAPSDLGNPQASSALAPAGPAAAGTGTAPTGTAAVGTAAVGTAAAIGSTTLAPAATPSTWQLVLPQAVVVGVHRGQPAWFNVRKLGLLGVILLTGGGLFGFARLARRRPLFVRRIAGVDAIEDSIGRATEMGKPVLYVTGVEEAQDIQTIAGLLILSHVAKLTAEYEADIRVANAHPLTMVVAEEMVRKGYADAGRLDAHKPDNVMFITSEQFAFAAGVNGIILRERPATNIYFGRFYAESLMLAETGYLTGAVQIAGTAELTQMPFFVAACDYTLIGEELFATSAYLTREPTQLAQLKAGDLLKVVLGLLAIVGALLATLHALGVLPSTALAVMEAVFP